MGPLGWGVAGFVAGKLLGGGGETPTQKNERVGKEMSDRADRMYRRKQKEDARLMGKICRSPEEEDDDDDDDD